MPEHGSDSARLLAAASFAAKKHRDQRRKGADATPYINGNCVAKSARCPSLRAAAPLGRCRWR